MHSLKSQKQCSLLVMAEKPLNQIPILNSFGYCVPQKDDCKNYDLGMDISRKMLSRLVGTPHYWVDCCELSEQIGTNGEGGPLFLPQAKN